MSDRTLPAPTTGGSAIRGMCRVCGRGLAGDVVQCPACDTPHHDDCWRYNGGRPVFGCLPASAAPAVSTGVVDPGVAAPPSLWDAGASRWLALGALWVMVCLALRPRAVAHLGLVAGLFLLARRHHQQASPALDAGDASSLADELAEALALERKAVLSPVGMTPDSYLQPQSESVILRGFVIQLTDRSGPMLRNCKDLCPRLLSS